MSRVWFKIFLIVLPVALVLGLVRLSVNGFEMNGQFLPSWKDLQSIFAQMPNVRGLWDRAIQSYYDAQNMMVDAFVNITDVASFFNAIGSFFAYLGGVFMFVFNVAAIPIKMIYWFFYYFFNWSPAVTTPVIGS